MSNIKEVVRQAKNKYNTESNFSVNDVCDYIENNASTKSSNTTIPTLTREMVASRHFKHTNEVSKHLDKGAFFIYGNKFYQVINKGKYVLGLFDLDKHIICCVFPMHREEMVTAVENPEALQLMRYFLSITE